MNIVTDQPNVRRPVLSYRDGVFHVQEATNPTKGSFLDNLQSVRDAQSKKLSPQDIAELKTKYHPDNMTQEEYFSFLDDLERKGVLSGGDKGLLKYPEMRFEKFNWEEYERTGIMRGGVVSIESNAPLCPRPFEEFGGDIIRYLKALLALENELAERKPAVKEDRQRIAALQTVSGILERMR